MGSNRALQPLLTHRSLCPLCDMSMNGAPLQSLMAPEVTCTINWNLWAPNRSNVSDRMNCLRRKRQKRQEFSKLALRKAFIREDTEGKWLVGLLSTQKGIWPVGVVWGNIWPSAVLTVFIYLPRHCQITVVRCDDVLFLGCIDAAKNLIILSLYDPF